MRRFILILAASIATVTLASEPGEPLGGEDWVILVPGVTGRDYLSPHSGRCNDGADGWTSDVCQWQSGNQVTADGDSFVLHREPVSTGVYCEGRESQRQEIYLLDAQSGERTLVAYLEDRCVPGSPGKADTWTWMVSPGDYQEALPKAKFSFDLTNGVLRFRMRTLCANCAFPSGTVDKIVEFSGFTTLFELQQTYDSTASGFAFRVPALPEGTGGADWFDTYYGDLATVGDWSQAHPLVCGYPATPPEPGDYLTVSDPLPDPGPGQGRYYITAVNYQGQRRFGRRSEGGVLNGRDPAVLPICK